MNDDERAVDMAIGFLKPSVKEYLIVIKSRDEKFEFRGSCHTWALGAARRVQVNLEAEEVREDGENR